MLASKTLEHENSGILRPSELGESFLKPIEDQNVMTPENGNLESIFTVAEVKTTVHQIGGESM